MTKRYADGVKSQQTDGEERGAMEQQYAEAHGINTATQCYAGNIDYFKQRYLKGKQVPTAVIEISGLDLVTGKPKQHHLTKFEKRYTGTFACNMYFNLARMAVLPFYVVIPNATLTYFCVARIRSSKFKIGSLKWRIQTANEHWNWVEIVDLSKEERRERKQMIVDIEKNGFERSIKKRALILRVDGHLKRECPKTWKKCFCKK